MFHRVGDNLQLIRKNIHFTAPAGTPLDKAVKQNYTDSILMALPILSISPRGGGLVIDFADIFMTDFAQVGFGLPGPQPLAMVQDPHVSRERRDPGGGDLQRRTIRELFLRRSANRRWSTRAGSPWSSTTACARPRTTATTPGWPTTASATSSTPSPTSPTPIPDTNAKRMINRWRLEKANPGAKLSPPKKQIVWYIEDNVPDEYRPYVQEGILEWNKAFEKIGFKDAIAVRWQNRAR